VPITDVDQSGFYTVADSRSGKDRIPNIFSTTDPANHRSEIRALGPHYTMMNIKMFEPVVDGTIAKLVGILDHRFADAVCDLGEWMKLCP
jgi:hypothetical protein